MPVHAQTCASALLGPGQGSEGTGTIWARARFGHGHDLGTFGHCFDFSSFFEKKVFFFFKKVFHTYLMIFVGSDIRYNSSREPPLRECNSLTIQRKSGDSGYQFISGGSLRILMTSSHWYFRK